MLTHPKGMSDPNAQVEAPQPIPPPRPAPKPDLTPEQTQMVKDEQYARQLAEHYNNQEDYSQDRRGSRPQDIPPRLPRRPNQQSHNDGMHDDRERNFIDGKREIPSEFIAYVDRV